MKVSTFSENTHRKIKKGVYYDVNLTTCKSYISSMILSSLFSLKVQLNFYHDVIKSLRIIFALIVLNMCIILSYEKVLIVHKTCYPTLGKDAVK